METFERQPDPVIATKLHRRGFSQNLQHHLWDRESGLNRHCCRRAPPHPLAFEKHFLKSISPNLTIQNVDKPHGYMRKFTPDGKMLLSFSHDQRSLEVFNYHGVARAASLLQRQRGECITAADHSLESLRVRQQVYEQLFTLRCIINVTTTTSSYFRTHLNREFSIFLENGKYVLLGANIKNQNITYLPPAYLTRYPDLYDDCDFVGDYCFFLIDLTKGCVTDTLKYQNDFIMLSHNHGVSVHGRVIAILSKCRQCIEIVEFVDGGKLVPLFTVGPMRGGVSPREHAAAVQWGQNILSHLKQRVCAYIYRSYWRMRTKHIRTKLLQQFYRNFKLYERMIMTKIQLIDNDHLLLRYEHRPSHRDDKLIFKLYVFYCISKAKVLKVYRKNSLELLYLLRDFCDDFRNVRSLQTQRPSCSPSNNAYFRDAFNSAINSIPGGRKQAALRFNSTLPISSQSFATTQYLDYSIFNYDDRLISSLERPKFSSLAPICFSDRDTNITKFRLYLEAPGNNGHGSNDIDGSRELVAFIFHPYEPFIISLQKVSTRYIVNFHIYNEATVVRQ